jgi:hypothetical protein
VSIDEAVARVKSVEPKAKALVIEIDGKRAVSYDYLCEECRGIVASYCDGTKGQTKKSARRFKRVIAEHPVAVRETQRPQKGPRSVAP